MTFQQLEYFIAAAEYGSISKAANAFFVSQTAITQQVRALEESIGTALFDRSCRPLRLTPAGEVFLMESRALTERLKTAISKTRGAAEGPAGNVRIGYIKGYERSDLSERLRKFHKQYPNFRMSLFRGDSRRLYSGLVNGEYDVIFTGGDGIPEDEKLCGRLYERAPLNAVVFDGHPFAQREKLERRELKNERIIYLTLSEDENDVGDARYLRLYGKSGFTPNIVFRSNDIESCLMMVAAEEGIAIVPSYILKKLENAENLTFIPLTGEEEYEAISCIWRAHDENPAVAAVLGCVFEGTK